MVGTHGEFLICNKKIISFLFILIIFVLFSKWATLCAFMDLFLLRKKKRRFISCWLLGNYTFITIIVIFNYQPKWFYLVARRINCRKYVTYWNTFKVKKRNENFIFLSTIQVYFVLNYLILKAIKVFLLVKWFL